MENEELSAKSLLDNLNVPVIMAKAVYDENKNPVDFNIIYVNNQYEKQTKRFTKPGETARELLSTLPPEIDWMEVCNHVITTGQTYENDYLSKRIHVWFNMKIQKYNDDYLVFTLTNVTNAKIKERHLEFLESNDKLTGLPDGKTFIRQLDSFISSAEKNKKRLALIVINLDDLQTINDFTGREAGDEVIVKSGNILQNMENSSTYSYRLDGDEFAIIKLDINSTEEIKENASEINNEFSKSGVSASLGISIYPLHDVNSRGLIKDADLAMHHVKNCNKGNFAIFEPKMYENFIENVQIKKKIVSGLELNQFQLYYQPQFYLGKHTLRGFEALIRWRDENGENHAPSTFIPIAEETNTIQILGNWIFETAVKQLKEWQDKYNFDGILSVNVSPIQLRSPQFVAHIKNIMEKYSIKRNSLELEITEGIFISDTEKTSEMLKELQNLGIKISLDDFGTGYSSLRYIGSMPINTLKFDKTFIDSISEGNVLNIDLLSALIPVTKRAGMETIAEGVENSEQLMILTDINCNCVQGFLWGKPMPVEKCNDYLNGNLASLDYLKE